MKHTPTTHLVVVDDVCRFALHLWSYLSNVPAFGIGNVSRRDGQARFFWTAPLADEEDGSVSRDRGEPVGQLSPDGRWRIWWVEARGGWWRSQLDKVVAAIRRDTPGRPEPVVLFLVDVRGPAHEDGEDHYRHREVLRELAALAGGDDPALPRFDPDDDRFVVLVSSYTKSVSPRPGGGGQRPVREKTAATFELIRDLVSTRRREHEVTGEVIVDAGTPQLTAPEQAPSRTGPVHVLVTGAGFDLGGWEPVRGLGSPSTAVLLDKALSGEDPTRGTDTGNTSRVLTFPVPRRLYADRGKDVPSDEDPGVWHLFIENAEVGNLDLYWENFLKLELDRRGGAGPGVVFDKVAAAAREQSLREAFRSALALHDWGLTSQTLDALQEPRLAAWLTTNYTRFPNRALDVLHNHGLLDDAEARPWRILSTSNEATLHLRKLLHGPGKPAAVPGAADEDGLDSYRYLFKLHGDIPHVTTMALAASDKEIYSPLSMPIDSLHWLYTTAEKHLEHLIGREQADVVWHIVGHGLKDRLLVDLMARVYRATAQRRHCFVVVGWNPEEPTDADDPGAILSRALGSPAGWRILCVEAKARDYLARLRADRLLAADDARGWEEWIRGLAAWFEHNDFRKRREIPEPAG